MENLSLKKLSVEEMETIEGGKQCGAYTAIGAGLAVGALAAATVLTGGWALAITGTLLGGSIASTISAVGACLSA